MKSLVVMLAAILLVPLGLGVAYGIDPVYQCDRDGYCCDQYGKCQDMDVSKLDCDGEVGDDARVCQQ